MFGQSVEKLLLYLAPIQVDDLDGYGYTVSFLEDLLSEKADIVFSYLPYSYRRAYASRVRGLVLIEFAKSGQTSIAMPFPSMSNVIGFLNPTGTIEDLRDESPVPIAVNSPNLSFSPLSMGDKLVIDFDNVLSGKFIKPLIWACNVLAAIDILSIISGDSRTGTVVERVKTDGERIFAWLSALNAKDKRDRLVIRDLEFEYWDGHYSPLENFEKYIEET
ncbi:MAG: hypothetical protein HUU50_02585 [Candidatus Brocadiae bacterium]|nr:hypothetical protein [Candidatus Brocadiia bacterium]